MWKTFALIFLFSIGSLGAYRNDFSPTVALNVFTQTNEKIMVQSDKIQIDLLPAPIRYCVVEPPKSAENGSAILFLHGIRSSTHYFKTIAKSFAEVGFHCFILEYPGYDGETWGGSVLLDRHNFPALSDYVNLAWREISENYELRSWIFWGYSMGAGILFRTMRDYPETFVKSEAIILESPAFAAMVRSKTKAAIRFGKFMQRGKGRRVIGKLIFKFGRLVRGRKLSGSSAEMEGYCDNFTVFAENADSMLARSNAFDRQITEKVGLDRFIWIWSPNDSLLNSSPPEWFLEENVVTSPVGHNISFSEPSQTFKQVLALLP